MEFDIKVNGAAAKKAVDDVGKSTDKLADSTDKLADSNDKLKNETESLAGSLEGLGGGFGGAISGAKALGTQFLALVANPIGATIAAVALVVTGLFKAFSRTEEGGNKLNKGMTVLSGVFSSVLKKLEPLANFIVDKVVGGFEALGKAASFATDLVSKGLRSLGFESAAKGLDNFTSSTDKLVKKSTELADIEAKLLKTRREQSLIEKQALLDAEKLRQKRDDESNSLEQRIEFNKQLGEVLKKQSNDELAIANEALRAAKLRLEIDGETTEALDGLAEAQLEILDIQERINGQQSEQLANENSLRNEGKALAKEKAEQRKAEKDAKQKEIDEAAELAQSEKDAEKLKEEEKLKLLAESQDRALELKRAHKLRLAEEGLNDDNLTPDEIRARYDAALEARNEIFEAEQEDINEKFEAELIGKQERDALLAESEMNQDASVTRNKEAQAEAQRLIEEGKANTIKTNLDNTANVLSAFGELASKETAEGKALSIAAATINTYRGVSDALAAKTVTPFETALKFANAAAIGFQGAANVKKILSVKVPKSSGGGGSAPVNVGISPSGRGSASAPSLNDDTLFSTQNLTRQPTEETAQNNEVRAYVVESEITDTQSQVLDFKTLSEIG